MLEKERNLGALAKGHSFEKFSKEELNELKDQIDQNELMNIDVGLTEEDENYLFDVLHGSFMKLSDDSVISNRDNEMRTLKDICDSIYRIHRSFELWSDDPICEIRDRLMNTYDDIRDDSLETLKLFDLALNGAYVWNIANREYLASLACVYARVVYSVIILNNHESFVTAIRHVEYGNTIIWAVLVQYSSLWFNMGKDLTKLDDTIEKMNSVEPGGLFTTLNMIDECIKDIKNSRYYSITDEDKAMIRKYASLCSSMAIIIRSTPMFNTDIHLEELEPCEDDVLDTNETNTPNYTLGFDKLGDLILKENGYAIENMVNSIISALTNVGRQYNSKLVGDNVRIVFDDQSPEIKGLIATMCLSSIDGMIKKLDMYYNNTNFSDSDDVYNTYVYTVLQLKLGSIIDVLERVKDTDSSNLVNIPNEVSRDITLYSYYTKLSKMIEDIGTIVIRLDEDSDHGLTEFPTIEVLDQLTDVYFSKDLDNHSLTELSTYIGLMKQYLESIPRKLTNAYDLVMANLSLSYVYFVTTLLELGDTGTTNCNIIEEEDLDEEDYESSEFDDITYYIGAVEHFTNVMTQVLLDELTLTGVDGELVELCDINYINIMKGLLSITENMTEEESLHVSAFISTMIEEGIAKAHIYNLKSKVMKHDPTIIDVDKSLDDICKETLHDMINILNKDIRRFFEDCMVEAELNDDPVITLYKSHMKMAHNIIRLVMKQFD